MMSNDLEIIVREAGASRSVDFESLYAIRDSIESLMLLWDTNSYYVDVQKGLFLINGGRKLIFPLKAPRLVYRRRTAIKVSGTTSVKEISWIVGLRGSEDDMILLVISESGEKWCWSNVL